MATKQLKFIETTITIEPRCPPQFKDDLAKERWYDEWWSLVFGEIRSNRELDDCDINIEHKKIDVCSECEKPFETEIYDYDRLEHCSWCGAVIEPATTKESQSC